MSGATAKKVAHGGLVHRDDARPAVLADVDVSFAGELPQDIANRRAGDPVLLAQPHFVDVLVRGALEGQNLSLERLIERRLAAAPDWFNQDDGLLLASRVMRQGRQLDLALAGAALRAAASRPDATTPLKSWSSMVWSAAAVVPR